MSHVPPPGQTAPRVPQTTRPIAAMPSQVSWKDPSQRTPLIILGGLVLLLVAAYWDMFALTSAAWSEGLVAAYWDMFALTSAAWSEGLYSHGWLVPMFALALLWMRWQPFGPVPAQERWIGLGLLVLGLSARLYAAEYGINPVDRISFLPAIFGAFMLVGGTHVVRWAWPALIFLVFMFPLPTVFERMILWNLQTLASICSTFVLQTLGMAAFRQGNLISIPGSELNIADACSGLRMATIFGAMAVAMVFLVERPWWDKFIILISAIPIALIVNVIRITVTGLIYYGWPGSEFAQKIGHDWAGYFMMPLALGFLWLELQVLERITIPVDTVQIRPVGGGRGMAVPVR